MTLDVTNEGDKGMIQPCLVCSVCNHGVTELTVWVWGELGVVNLFSGP